MDNIISIDAESATISDIERTIKHLEALKREKEETYKRTYTQAVTSAILDLARDFPDMNIIISGQQFTAKQLKTITFEY